MNPTVRNLTREFGLERISANHVILPPQSRSSVPHAESLEEEFAFVIQGHPHLWINGYLYQLGPGWAVGFAAGTGVAHCLINNSQENVQLLVLGEATKKENQFCYPINPELNKDEKNFWASWPRQELGPQNGLPGPFDPKALRTDFPTYVKHVPSLARRNSHYPGDSETFGEGARLTAALELKSLGIWYDVLPPGKRSAYPHAHTHEEEFAYVLEGNPTLWQDGQIASIGPNEFVGFRPNTGVSHCLINDTDKPVVYIGLGETREFEGEKILYPLHPLREKECVRKGWYWLNPPAVKLGPHSSESKIKSEDHLKFRLATESNLEEILQVYQSSPQYFLKVDGAYPSLEMVKNNLAEGPKKRSSSYFKEFLIVDLNGEPIGVIDLHANHPEQEFAYIGLLLIGESLFGQGIGRRVYRLLEDYCRRSLGAKKIRLGVSSDNDVSRFWTSVGFAPNGSTYSWTGENKTTLVTEFEKSI